MLTTVKAEVDVGGNVRLLEPLEVSKTTQAIVTLLDENGKSEQDGNVRQILDYLRANKLPDESRPSAEEIDEQITEARNSWD